METAMVISEIRVPVGSDSDIVKARQQGRALAVIAGFTDSDLVVISTAISEVARNIVEQASSGEIVMRVENEASTSGLTVIARDGGPGISNISLAMQNGHSTKEGLGPGLPGIRR